LRPCEEERRQKCECDDAQPLLFLAVLGVMSTHDEPEHERRQHSVPVRRVREHHQDEQRHEHELDLRLDHAVAVAAEERRRNPRQRDDQRERGDEEDREPQVRLEARR
jgi:hypothetical protein